MKTIHLAVSEFALPSPRTGHIEAHSGYGPTPDAGMEIHQALQASRGESFPEFEAEKAISRTFEKGGYKFVVSGRMDGFYHRPQARIEEIKSTIGPIADLAARLRDGADHPYLLQLRTYGYFHWLQSRQEPELALLLVSARNRDLEELPVALDLDGYAAWLERRLAELVKDARECDAIEARRRRLADDFQFPFSQPRAGQLELVAAVEDSLKERRPLLAQAPTGLGKTAGVLSPALKEACGRGQRVLYVTPKNSQHAVAEETVRLLQEAGNKVKAMTLTSKAKMCFKNEPICNPRSCEFARDYYTKVAEHGLIEKLAKKRNLTARVFRRMAREHGVCPFELQIDVSARADVVICDYNYVFAPRNALGRLTSDVLWRKGQPNLVIDEAHNLPARAMDYFSPRLPAAQIVALRERCGPWRGDLEEQVREWVDRAVLLIREQRPSGRAEPGQVVLKPRPFADLREELDRLVSRFLESGQEPKVDEPLLRLHSLWMNFVEALEDLEGDAFFCTWHPDPEGGELRIVCCDASAWLAEGYKHFANVVAFSATLKPFDYYTRLSGFDAKKVRTLEFNSPFPREHRKLLVIPQVSTKYKSRDREADKIRDAIERIIRLRPGNYFVFFPSFQFMESIAAGVELPGFEILCQERTTKTDRIEEILEKLRSGERPTVIFAVQGGVFSEGVDYPGEMLIGAIIVGPALPTFDLEHELMRGYYEERHGQGFDYVYTYPAMAKVVQAAGRVIRSPSDRGLIVLMDRRFTEDNYARAMPADWFEGSVRSLVSTRILEEIGTFWKEGDLEPS